MIIILIMAFLPADFMFQTHEDTHDHSPSTSLNILPCFPHQDFHAVGPIVVKRSMSFSNAHKCEDGHVHGDDDLSDDGSNGGSEKKRRLGTEQVRALEKSFELGNKLEPERKTQLARALGLQPRQVAIWFQNRRARWKTKQLERDYDILKKKYEAVKAENDRLQSCNKKLDEELLALRSKESPGYETINIKKETDQRSWSNGSENSSDRNLDLSTTQTQITKFVTASPKSFTSKNFFPASLNIRPASLSQLFQSSSRLDHHVAPKLDQIIHEENLCNVFTGIDDQHGLWPWMEQHHFH